jgi:pyruvate dehydrogenase E1 component alpha subunit
MASLWKLPVIYVIENNHYAMGTHVGRASALAEELYHRGSVFGIPGEQVDGMDVAAVKSAGDRAMVGARRGDGPKILEMLTYRYRGHSMSDPAKYRTREEVQQFREHRDPIELLRSRMLKDGRTSENDLKEIDREVRARVNEAAEFAQSDPEPDPSELFTDVTAT